MLRMLTYNRQKKYKCLPMKIRWRSILKMMMLISRQFQEKGTRTMRKLYQGHGKTLAYGAQGRNNAELQEEMLTTRMGRAITARVRFRI
jgi:hypothetical protein